MYENRYRIAKKTHIKRMASRCVFMFHGIIMNVFFVSVVALQKTELKEDFTFVLSAVTLDFLTRQIPHRNYLRTASGCQVASHCVQSSYTKNP